MRNRNRSLDERVKEHPYLRDRFDQLLGIVEDADGDIEKADEAERRVIEELRQLGQELLGGWAVGKEKQRVNEVRSKEKAKFTSHGKKNSAGTQRSDK